MRYIAKRETRSLSILLEYFCKLGKKREKVMLKDIPYNVLKENERAYKIMLLRDQYNNSFNDIAKELELSVTGVKQIYHKLKFKQIWLYINHISAALGYDNNSQIKKVFEQADKCYQDRTYACAYLEKKYKDILTEYRNGEPGMSQQFLKSMPPFKPKLNKKTVARIIEMRENEKASFVKIAKEFRITRQKAKYTYDWYYHVKMLELIKILQKKAKSEQEKREIWEYCFRNSYSSKNRYEMLRKNRF